MTADANGWQDSPEDEREELDAWEADDERWRGEVHVEDWPEHLAGPEYWLYRSELEDDD